MPDATDNGSGAPARDRTARASSRRARAVRDGWAMTGAGLALLAALMASPARAQAQAPAVPAAAALAQERALLEDTDTLLALTADGAALYAKDPVKLSGYQYCSQSVVLAEAGEFRQSVRAASKALHLATTNGDDNLMALAQRDLAIVYSYSGQLEKAQEFANAALRHAAKEPALVQGPAHKVIADVLARRGDHAAAVLSYEQALRTASPRYAPLVKASLANALIESGETARARVVFDSLPSSLDASLAAEIDRTRARLLLAEDRPAEARDLYRRLTARRSGKDVGYDQVWAWDGVARSELAMGRKEEAADAVANALAGIDKVRARFRSEEFKMGLFSDLQSVFERAIDLYTGLGRAREALAVSELSRSRALLDAVRGRTRLPDDAAATVEVASMQRLLRADERIVEFHALPGRLQAWVIGPQEIRSRSIEIPREELAELVDGFRNSIVRGRRSAVDNGARLGAALLAPLGLEPDQRLIIVPSGPLHYLPFQALRLGGRYLIETNPVSVAPSASIALQLAQRTPRAAATLVAFGNPRIADKYELPGAAAEVRALEASFPGATAYLGAAATKSRLQQTAAGVSIVHVAAHAEADQVDPLYSRILLANEGGRQNFLEAHEITELPLGGTALVTLSACESALGRIARGDEVLGFTRSFLSAGASSLVSSLWPVSDDATALLMGTAYRELASGQDVQRSMRAGQLAVMRNPSMSHPFFWAPFNLIGDWRLRFGDPA